MFHTLLRFQTTQARGVVLKVRYISLDAVRSRTPQIATIRQCATRHLSPTCFFCPALLSISPLLAEKEPEDQQKNLFHKNEYATCSRMHLLEELDEIYHKKVVPEKQEGLIYYIKKTYEYIQEGIKSIARFIELVIIFSPLLLSSPILFFERYRSTWYRMFTSTVVYAGPTFVKLSQWIATRPDVFPLKFCLELSRLHDNTEPLPFSVMKPLIEKEIGGSIEDLFEYLDPEPLGCGAIAQVYKGKLKNAREDREIVIKIKKPYVDESFYRDFSIVNLIGTIADYIPIVNRLTPKLITNEFYKFFTCQLDLYEEASNLIRFRKNFQDDDTVVFPEPFLPLCNRNMLVETYEEGIKLTSVLQHNTFTPEERHRIASLGLKGFFHMMLIDNFIHGDMHPGNLLVRPNVPCQKVGSISYTHSSFPSSLLITSPNEHNTRFTLFLKRMYSSIRKFYYSHVNAPTHPQLVVLDAGIVSALEETQKRNFIDLFLALAQGDGYESGRLLIERAPQPAPPVRDPDGFCRKIEHLVDDNMENGEFILCKLKVSETLARMLSYSIYHHVRLDTRFVTLFLSVIILEGVGRQLDDHMSMVEQVLPIIRAALPEYEDAVRLALHQSPPIRKTVFSIIKNLFTGKPNHEPDDSQLQSYAYEHVLEQVDQFVQEEENKDK